jgi:tetratricopeptide (TPR) repeat protein
MWKTDIYGAVTTFSSWNDAYKRIFYTNLVLEGMEKIVPKNPTELIAWSQAKGSALFFRAYNHYLLSQLFCKTYDKTTAQSDLGIPLRLQSDINITSFRSTVQQTYEQIINDLKQALDLLPVSTPVNVIYKCRPTKVASNAMLARVYLSMDNYDSALVYSNKALGMYSYLMDFNNSAEVNTSPSVSSSFTQFNKEVIFQMTLASLATYLPNRAFVEPALYNQYSSGDIRKAAFFKPGTNVQFKGSYDGGSGLKFGGLATDEMYLIRAECYARKNDTTLAMKDLNDLLRTRWVSNSYMPYHPVDANDALRKIISERRKELCFRDIRWTDLRRLNKEPQFAVTLNRTVNGTTYSLPPNDPRYVFPIPVDVIQLTGIQQNIR